jgi:hypothetical protein
VALGAWNGVAVTLLPLLGKLPARHDPRTLMLAKYLHTTLPVPPASCDWGKKVPRWPMYLNDKLGDCTCAAAAHMIQAWTRDAGPGEVRVTDAAVLKAYEAVGGYRPGDPSTDQGAVELDVLKFWRKTGIGGHKIAAFASIDPRSSGLVRDGIYLFGGIYAGVELPASAQDQDVWDVPAGGPVGSGEPGSWGGHAVPIVAYDTRGLTCVTWGAELRMTWGFFATYFSEAYAVLSNDFLHGGRAPNGFNTAQLLADLAAVGGSVTT